MSAIVTVNKTDSKLFPMPSKYKHCDLKCETDEHMNILNMHLSSSFQIT